ncbi:four-carbon acid sugar kinase family protein [Dyadobacter aurulentus]|uniref:four-carbon acid sugar kinase family protein n=1 Tax=Dyadobacter sp. UC 10 TaxID=2605428 RepID=UPI0011F1B5CD|nr:four-carbon acid sugar kinase family protein [Dyadobacter sp. UC 10]KAA0988801.1 four-carbon acid sugar kinase family protein [Dyadobacter sp. UC 10]
MIAVIADDFTGAAEIGGVGIRNGFRVVIDTKVDSSVETDILIIATDTRSQAPAQAADLIKKTTQDLLALKPEFIYKKMDSILRGNVGEELLAQLHVSGKERALLIPANPVLKRTIKDGTYYYDGMPLNEFSFTNGTVKKRVSSKVIDLIGGETGTDICVISTHDELAEKGLMIGNTSTLEDLEAWVKKVDEKTIPSGGSGFFDAILRGRKDAGKEEFNPVHLGEKILYVCGSAFIDSRLLVKASKESGQEVIYMPEKLFCSDDQDERLISAWTADVIDSLEKKNKVILAIDNLECGEVENLPAKIRKAIADVVENVLSRSKVDELIIEGGSTSFSIIQRLNYTRFFPTHEFGPGSIRMRIEEQKDIFLTLKPGSYVWPESIWEYPVHHQMK